MNFNMNKEPEYKQYDVDEAIQDKFTQTKSNIDEINKKYEQICTDLRMTIDKEIFIAKDEMKMYIIKNSNELYDYINTGLDAAEKRIKTLESLCKRIIIPLLIINSIIIATMLM